ncbi:MAG: hypothetical protein GY833_05265 [Aestuariibacter sp.]|nr:hypothetical protein [Aestuariibacter sp.]
MVETYEAEAKYLKLKLVLGLAEQNEVISWADKIIEENKVLPPHIIDLSLSGSKCLGETMVILDRIVDSDRIGEITVPTFEKILGDLYRHLESGRISSDKVAELLYDLSIRRDTTLPEEYESFCIWVDDEFALVRQGMKDREFAESELRKFLSQTIEE